MCHERNILPRLIELQVVNNRPSAETHSSSDHADVHRQLNDPGNSPRVVFSGAYTWRRRRPSTLVVACSDGRLQKSIDEFLEQKLGVVDYDRLYAPGGPGCLGIGTFDIRTDQLKRELKFLIEAHQIEEIVLLFHGAGPGGPSDSVCAHYKRLLPDASVSEIERQQHEDALEALKIIARLVPQIPVLVYRAEVHGDGTVRFVDLRSS